jgi:hypothetical protein
MNFSCLPNSATLRPKKDFCGICLSLWLIKLVVELLFFDTDAFDTQDLLFVIELGNDSRGLMYALGTEWKP